MLYEPHLRSEGKNPELRVRAKWKAYEKGREWVQICHNESISETMQILARRRDVKGNGILA